MNISVTRRGSVARSPFSPEISMNLVRIQNNFIFTL